MTLTRFKKGCMDRNFLHMYEVGFWRNVKSSSFLISLPWPLSSLASFVSSSTSPLLSSSAPLSLWWSSSSPELFLIFRNHLPDFHCFCFGIVGRSCLVYFLSATVSAFIWIYNIILALLTTVLSVLPGSVSGLANPSGSFDLSLKPVLYVRGSLAFNLVLAYLFNDFRFYRP